jgi:SulP family sulfate permease
MTAIDATGVHALEQFAERLRETGKTLVFCGARDQPRKLLSRTEFLKRVGPENFLPHVQAALARAREINGEFEKIGEEMAVEMEEHPL